jgi:membrane-associated HD superfamily phosphohydrolase
VREHFEDFQKNDRKRTSLLDPEGGQLRRDREAKNSIITTWQISFDYIREIRPSAADLLSLMSFFDRQGVPETVLRNSSEQTNSWQDQHESEQDESVCVNANNSDDYSEKTSQSSGDDEFEDDILALRNYSFISMNTDRTTFEKHRLVQLATREEVEQQFIKNLDIDLPTGKYENSEKCRTLFPHAQLALAQHPEAKESLLGCASVIYKAACYAWTMGKGLEAEKMSVQSMKIRKKTLGKEHNDTLRSMTMVSHARMVRGQWDAAELFVQVMETSKTKLGADHPSTLTSMANLAARYWQQGRWEEAEVLELQVMETRKTKLGVNHPSTLNSMGRLASIYRKRGRWGEAEALELQVMETRKTKPGGR